MAESTHINAVIRAAAGRGVTGATTSTTTAAPDPDAPLARRTVANAAVEALKQLRYAVRDGTPGAGAGWGTRPNDDGSLTLYVAAGQEAQSDRAATSLVRDLRVRGFDAAKRSGAGAFAGAVDIPGRRARPSLDDVDAYFHADLQWQRVRPTGSASASPDGDGGVAWSATPEGYRAVYREASDFAKNGHHGWPETTTNSHTELGQALSDKFASLGYTVRDDGAASGFVLAPPEG